MIIIMTSMQGAVYAISDIWYEEGEEKMQH